MTHLLLDYENNREVVKETLKAGVDAFVVPVLKGKEFELTYLKGKLVVPKSTTKQKRLDDNHIPRDLFKDHPKWGGFKVKEIKVQCLLSNDRIIALDVEIPEGKYHSIATNFHLLLDRGFVTRMTLSGWINFQKCKSPSEAEKLLKERLKLVNQVVKGKRTTLWTDSGSPNTRESTFKYQGLDSVDNLIVVNAIQFKPTVNSDKVRAVYKT